MRSSATNGTRAPVPQGHAAAPLQRVLADWRYPRAPPPFAAAHSGACKANARARIRYGARYPWVPTSQTLRRAGTSSTSSCRRWTLSWASSPSIRATRPSSSRSSPCPRPSQSSKLWCAPRTPAAARAPPPPAPCQPHDQDHRSMRTLVLNHTDCTVRRAHVAMYPWLPSCPV